MYQLLIFPVLIKPFDFVNALIHKDVVQMDKTPTSGKPEPEAATKQVGSGIDVQRMGQATKYDRNKPRMALIPIRAKREVAKVFTYGAMKYDVGNWHSGDGFDYDRLQSASERHGDDFALGIDLDPESGYHHLAHRIACDMMLLEHCLTNLGHDNRTKTQIVKPSADANADTEASNG